MNRHVRPTIRLICATLFVLSMLTSSLLIPPSLRAEVVRIVAVGASNTNGKGVSKAAAWPARLQAMLKEKGVDAQVAVNAVNASTTSQMRDRLERAIATNPRIVILSIPLTNDRRRKVDTYENIAKMRSMLEKRGIKEILINRPHVWAEHKLQKDRIHFTVEGHKTVAAKLLPLVLAELNSSD